MFKRTIIWATLTIFIAIGLIGAPVLAEQEIAVVNKLTAMETLIYGTSSPGSLLERINKLETDVYGEAMDGSLFQRIDNLSRHVSHTAESSPSMLTKINAVEWMVSHSISYDSIQNKINSLERTISGSGSSAPLDARLAKLVGFTFPHGEVEIIPAILPQDSLIKVELLSPLNSTKSKEGDVIDLVVNEDVLIGSVLIIPKGAKGVGTVTKAVPAKNFGRDAKLEISIDYVGSIDGNIIHTYIGDKAKEETLSLAKATGASLAGIVILGPVGVIGGAFINGQNIDIPEGSQIYVQTKDVQDVYGVTIP